MSTIWVVDAPQVPAANARWFWLAGAAGAVAHGDLTELAAALGAEPGRAITVLVPAARVISVPVTLPVRQQRQMLPALPFLLEENLASEIDHLHVVAGARIDDQKLQAVAVDRRWLAELIALLGSVGIDPAVITSDALALPLPAAPGGKSATLLLDGADSVLATSDGHTLGFDQADAPVLAATLALGSADVAQVLTGARADALVVSALASEWDLGDAGPRLLVSELPRERLAILAEAVAVRPPVNLREGAFAHTDENLFALGFDWRPLAWLAASWAVLALGYQVAVGVIHSRGADSVQQAQVALYRQIFPGSVKVELPRRQMENQLRSSGSGGSFAQLVAETSAGLAALDANAADRHYTPRTLAWDAEQAQLRVDIVARSLEDLEKLRLDLERRGLRVEIGAGVSQDGGYKARMNVGAGQAVAGKGGA